MPSSRLAVLDLCRGLAVVAMVIYHLSWDLSWFGLVDWPVARGEGWRWFARLIAGGFLFLAGISLDLAHHDRLRWRGFGIRLAKIAAAALAVSVATWFAFADNFVRFGILHCIAASSLISLVFLRLPLLVVVAAAIVFLSLPIWGSSFVFNGQLWLWTGLGTPDYGSVDYVPVAPWTGVMLAGLAGSRAFRDFAIWERFSGIALEGHAGRFTRLLGRHSLPIYLIHQPVLYGLVWAISLLGPPVDPAENAFKRSCTASCTDNFGERGVCEAACSCTLERLKADGIWLRLNEDPNNQTLIDRMNEHYTWCLADPEMPFAPTQPAE